MGSSRDGALSTEKPMMADAFVDSIGVNTHLIDDLTDDHLYSLIVQRMQQLGIRHVRDGIFPGQSSAQNNDERRFFAATGANMLALTDCPKPLGYFPGAQTPPAVVRAFNRNVGNVIEFLEGPNEPDLRNVKNWAPLTRTCIARDDRHQALPVPYVAPAMGNGLNAPALGNISSLIDVGAIHRYFSGHNPGTKGFLPGGTCGRWEAMSWNVCVARINAGPTAPLFITETGYTTAGTVDSSDGSGVIDAKTIGKYISRVLFMDSLAGIQRTYLYELHDDGKDASNPQDGYGLFTYDGTPKPSFHAVRTIIGLLSDRGAAFTPAPLAFGVAGAGTIRHELFQKRNGTYILAIWNEVSSWNPSTGNDIPVSPSQVVLTFAAAPSKVRYEALNDAGLPATVPVKTRGATVTIAVDDHAAFLSFTAP
jgi:hypothetical protein